MSAEACITFAHSRRRPGVPEGSPVGLPGPQALQGERPGKPEIRTLDRVSNGVEGLVVAEGKCISLLAVALEEEPVAYFIHLGEALRGVIGESSRGARVLVFESDVARLTHPHLFWPTTHKRAMLIKANTYYF